MGFSPAVDEVSFIFVQGAIEEDAFAIELSIVKKALIPVERVILHSMRKTNLKGLYLSPFV